MTLTHWLSGPIVLLFFNILIIISLGATRASADGSQTTDQPTAVINHDANNHQNTDKIDCPSTAENSACPCYKFDDGLFLECPGTTAMSLQTTLQAIRAPIHSLSVYDFDRRVTSLTPELLTPTSGSSNGALIIRHLQFSQSYLETLRPASLEHLSTSLESLSIVNGKLKEVPQKALSGLKKLMILDLEANEIGSISDYSFYGLHLIKLNIKSNRLHTLPEFAFNGLESTLTELDLSGNRLIKFPMAALRRLEYLRIVRLAANAINHIEEDSASLLLSLVSLDMSDNEITTLQDNCFRAFPSLQTLSLYSNKIDHVYPNAFQALNDLETIDLSRNKIIDIDAACFSLNKRLQTIDLSHNHIHYVTGVFSQLPELKEIFLTGNNVLELTEDCFFNSSQISVIFLEHNSIKEVHADVLTTLTELEQLNLSENFIEELPKNLFRRNKKLTSLSLDGNLIRLLPVGLFVAMDQLRELRLHNNLIKSIEFGVFDKLQTLVELHMQQNDIGVIERDAFSTLPNLQHINLQKNKLKVLERVFAANGNLISIQLDANRIEHLANDAISTQSSVKTIRLSDNRLRQLNASLFGELRHLERLFIDNNAISDIDDNTFAAMPQVKHLDMSINQLTTLHASYFHHLLQLEDLNLATNQIQHIEMHAFDGLGQLKTLDLSNNFLRQLSKNMFDQLPVSVLNLRNCSLQTIEPSTFSSLPNLNDLNLEHNQLNAMDVKQIDVSSLRQLKLAGNPLRSTELTVFERMPSLQMLSLVDCDLSSPIPTKVFAKNINLVKLDLSQNKLKQIDKSLFNGLNVFKELRMNQNQLSEFPRLFNLSTLESLQIASNQLQTVDFFRLMDLTNLRHLDLSRNSIGSVTGFGAVNLTQLDFIDFSNNFLITLPTNFLRHSINLQRVDLSGNKFHTIPAAALSSRQSMTRLGWLNMTANPLQQIHSTASDDVYQHLREIHISYTNLTLVTSKDFEAFPTLQHLHLMHNRLNRISPGAFATLKHLLTLDLSVNELDLMPSERLVGLVQLKVLNMSHNRLRELEEFPLDLAEVDTLDLAYNQLDQLRRNVFINLVTIRHLNLMGNRLTNVDLDVLKPLRRLAVLDLRRNYFETLPLRTLRAIETHLQVLRVGENPILCTCDSQELWEWLRDHQKWTMMASTDTTEVLDHDDFNDELRCEQPAELRGHVFVQLEPPRFCDTPFIVKLAIQDIRPYSVVVSWQSREHSGLHGHQVVYHALDGVDEVRWESLSRFANSAFLSKLESSTRYRICVLGLGDWTPFRFTRHQKNQIEKQLDNPLGDEHFDHTDRDTNKEDEAVFMALLSADNSIVRCTEVRTLDALPHFIADEQTHGFFHSLLTRRLGLIVGCCMGIIVFIVLISVLGYLKLKKQRIENAKRQQPLPTHESYLSYRHFSIPHDQAMAQETCHHLPATHFCPNGTIS